uniref:Uncharacterized protein n=1 Tax=Plectus sambesii TaxID=2011161 RepID=A0A914XME1_9BILA
MLSLRSASKTKQEAAGGKGRREKAESKRKKGASDCAAFFAASVGVCAGRRVSSNQHLQNLSPLLAASDQPAPSAQFVEALAGQQFARRKKLVSFLLRLRGCRSQGRYAPPRHPFARRKTKALPDCTSLRGAASDRKNSCASRRSMPACPPALLHSVQ